MKNKSKKIHFVYITTNLNSGKQYVGSHSTTNINDGYLGGGIILNNYINKLGKKNFKRDILEFCESNEKARKLESYYIKENNTLKPFGYNISPKGGMGVSGCHHDDSKMKISKSLKDKFESGVRIQWNTGKTFSKEYRDKMSIIISKIMQNGVAEKISKSMMGKKNHFWKGKFSEESLKKMSESKKGKTLEEIYGKEKAKELRINKSLSTSGYKNNMYRKSLMDVWTKKYGREEAKLRYIKGKANLKKAKQK